MSETFGADVKSGRSPQELTIAQENHVILLMGHPGAGKTRLLAGWAKRLLVQQTDPPEKAITYESAGYLPSPVQHGKFCDFQDFYSPSNLNDWCTRVEFFGEDNPLKPSAQRRFEERMKVIEKDIAELGIRTLGLDGITSVGEAARFYNDYVQHPADGRLNYKSEAYFLDMYVKSLYPGLVRFCNVIITAHPVDRFIKEGEKDDRTPRRVPSGPGKFGEQVGGKFAEVWRIYQDEKGNYVLQTNTRGDNQYGCMSLRGVPDRTPAHWKAVAAFLEERKRRQEAVVKKEAPGTK